MDYAVFQVHHKRKSLWKVPDVVQSSMAKSLTLYVGPACELLDLDQVNMVLACESQDVWQRESLSQKFSDADRRIWSWNSPPKLQETPKRRKEALSASLSALRFLQSCLVEFGIRMKYVEVLLKISASARSLMPAWTADSREIDLS